MDIEKKVRNEELYTKCRWSPYDGWKLKGWPVASIVNENIIFEDNNVNEKIKAREVEIDEI
jgi:dihydroorotase